MEEFVEQRWRLVRWSFETPLEGQEVAAFVGDEPAVIECHREEFGGGGDGAEDEPDAGIEAENIDGDGAPGADSETDVEKEVGKVVAEGVEPFAEKTEFVFYAGEFAVDAVDDGVDLVEGCAE